MHTSIPSHELKRSWHSCPRRANAGNNNKNTRHAPSTKTECNYLNGWINMVTYAIISPKMVNPRDIAWERRRRTKRVPDIEMWQAAQWLNYCYRWKNLVSTMTPGVQAEERRSKKKKKKKKQTRGVTVSMSAFLACHQCYCEGSSLAWGLNLRAVVCGIFWSSSPGAFSGYSGFLPSFIGFNGSANKIKLK